MWSELVKSDTELPFFFGAVCACESREPGAPFAMRSKNGKHTSAVGEVLDFSPPHRYAHTFKFTAYDDPPCTIIYELKETDAGVEFSLITENVPTGSKTEKSMGRGGPFIINNLKAMIETGRPTTSGGLILMMIRLFEGLTPKRAAPKTGRCPKPRPRPRASCRHNAHPEERPQAASRRTDG